MTQRVPERHELPVERTWDLEDIFPTPAAWEAAAQNLEKELQPVLAYKGRLAEGAETLYGYFQALETFQPLMGKVFVYASLGYSTNTADQEAVGRYDRGRGLMGKTSAALAFAEPEMIAIGFDTLNQWLASYPPLSAYQHLIDRLQKKQTHVRSAEVEQLLGMLRDPFGTASATHGILADADLQFAPAVDSQGQHYEVAQSSIRNLIDAPDRELRRTAYESYAKAHLSHKNTMANLLAAGVKQNVFMARARGYSSALEAALDSTHIPPAVFHSLLETYQKNLPTWHKYWRVRRQALGLEKLYEYDIKAPLTSEQPVVSYEQAVEWIAAGMAPLGEEYVSVLKKGCLEERWVDVYPNKGKRMGAFSSGVKGTKPYIMMSYTDDLFGLSTLAHELGHSLHSYYTRQAQQINAYTWYGLFAAEVASNFNQAMTRDYLFRQFSDKNFQIAVIEEAMANFHRYFFIMPNLARFEWEIHQRVERGQALNADSLNSLMADLFQEGYGSEVEVDREQVGCTWAQFHTHLYANFYVYQYATGISGAHALAGRVLRGEPNAAENYLAFLKAGGSQYPLDVLKLAGVDMASPEPVEQTFAVLGQLVDRLESLVLG